MDIARASIKRKSVVLFLCALLAAWGTAAYLQIGKLEDPAFTIKTAIVTTVYPGSTAYETEREVTSRIEDAVQTMGEIKHIRSRSAPGLSMVYVDIKDKFTEAELPQIWDKLRQKIADVQPQMPAGCTTVVNNDYGDVYGQYYALVGDGYSMRELWDYADYLRKQLVLVPQVARVEIVGEQQEAIYVETPRSKVASFGLDPNSIIGIFSQQNQLSSAGSAYIGERYSRLSPTGGITSVEDIGSLVIGGQGGTLLRLREVADIRRDYMDPQSFVMRRNGRTALGIGISTVTGGNVVVMGEAVKRRLKELTAMTPVGMELQEIYMQSDEVTRSTNDFVINLAESLVIVVGVLLIFMGVKTGVMVGAVLLLTIAATLIVMNEAGIFLQIVSLAALIIALGSLVDNSIVVSEGMLVGVQRGHAAADAASESVESTKWAMLGGTFIAVLAFVPIGLSPHMTGEFCRSLYQVVGISMLLSWLLAVTVSPVLGVLVLKPSAESGDPYGSPLFRGYRRMLECCLRHRACTILSVLALLALSIAMSTQLDLTFFPDSGSAYYTVDLWQPEGISLKSQLAVTRELEEYLAKQPEVKNVTSFVGGGSLRFILTYLPADPDSAYSQILVETHGGKSVPSLMEKTQKYMRENMPNVDGACKAFGKCGYGTKIEGRIYGEDPSELRRLAERVQKIVEADPDHNFVRTDWRNPVEVLRPQVMVDQMRTLGLTRPQINSALQMATRGMPIGVFRDGDRSIPILAAVPADERDRIDSLSAFPLWAPAAGKAVPLGTLVSGLRTEYEDNIVVGRDRSRMITVGTEIRPGANAERMIARMEPAIRAIELPVGYSFEWGGERELQNEAVSAIGSMCLPCLLLMFTVLVFLFNGFKQPLIISASIPMILIGVVPGLYFMNMPFSFMALLGVLSLVGMIVKNTIVLLDEVTADFAAGKDHYATIVDSGVSRLRPVSMSALTTVLGMLPLVWDVLFAPMAVTIMAGLTASTVLTLIVIPVITAAAYKVKNPE